MGWAVSLFGTSLRGLPKIVEPNDRGRLISHLDLWEMFWLHWGVRSRFLIPFSVWGGTGYYLEKLKSPTAEPGWWYSCLHVLFIFPHQNFCWVFCSLTRRTSPPRWNLSYWRASWSDSQQGARRGFSLVQLMETMVRHYVNFTSILKTGSEKNLLNNNPCYKRS